MYKYSKTVRNPSYHLYFLNLLLQLLDVLLCLSSSSVGAVESNLKLVDVLLQLLLASQSLGLASSLGLETCLHRVEGTLMVTTEQGTEIM